MLADPATPTTRVRFATPGDASGASDPERPAADGASTRSLAMTGGAIALVLTLGAALVLQGGVARFIARRTDDEPIAGA